MCCTTEHVLIKSRPKNLREGRGSIVNVASMLGTTASAPGTYATDYTATKHGVMGLTKADAIAYGTPEHRIRINAISPGVISTPMVDDIPTPLLEDIQSKHPIGRLGKPEEIANAVVWLCSDKASFVTGHNMVIDGGYTAQ